MKHPRLLLVPLVVIAVLGALVASTSGATAEPGTIGSPPTGQPPTVGTVGPWGPGDPLSPFAAALPAGLTATAAASRYLGPALSGIVVDATDGRVLWRYRDATGRMPASVQKVLTAYTVLESMPADTVLATSTCRSAGHPAAVYLRGGGDPSLSAARIRQLAAQTVRALPTPRPSRVSVHVDGSLFPAPTPAPGWKASYLRSDVQLVRGLTVAGYRGTDGRLAAGTALAKALASGGLPATVAGAATAPADCATLATTRSAPVGALVGTMLLRSDNDYAEFLLRHAALARGRPATWQGAADHELRLLTEAGVPTAGLSVADGSGLSRSTRVRVETVARVLLLLRQDAGHAAIVFGAQGLPVAGRTGTLSRRFAASSQRCARGLVRAKTGTLDDAVALAGVAPGRDGRARVFVLIDNGQRRLSSVQSALDGLATAVTGCRAG